MNLDVVAGCDGGAGRSGYLDCLVVQGRWVGVPRYNQATSNCAGEQIRVWDVEYLNRLLTECGSEHLEELFPEGALVGLPEDYIIQ